MVRLLNQDTLWVSILILNVSVTGLLATYFWSLIRPNAHVLEVTPELAPSPILTSMSV
jgi:hypothetical protein